MSLDVVAEFGLVGDGATDNYPKFREMVEDSRFAGETCVTWPSGGFKLVMPAGVQTLYELQPLMTFRGVPGGTVILVYSAADEEKLVLRCSRPATAHAAFDGISIARKSPFSGALVSLACGSHLDFRRCSFDGGGSDPTIAPKSGILFGVMYAQNAPGTSLCDVDFERCRFAGCGTGIGSPNQGFAAVRRLAVRNCLFAANLGPDVVLNAPNQTVEQETSNTVPEDRPFLQDGLRVEGCDFEDNQAGIGVNLAHVRGVTVSGNSFTGYAQAAIQVEDHTHAALIAGNRSCSCATSSAALGAITVLGASHALSILCNDFEQVDSPGACILVTGGSTPGQYSQLPDPSPYNLLIVGNRGRLGKGAGFVDAAGRPVTYSDNSFTT
jgi:hypothetical protein